MDEQLVRKSIELAQKAKEKGNEPFGACLVKDGEIIQAVTGKYTQNLFRLGY